MTMMHLVDVSGCAEIFPTFLFSLLFRIILYTRPIARVKITVGRGGGGVLSKFRSVYISLDKHPS